MNSRQRLARECDSYEKAHAREYALRVAAEQRANVAGIIGGWTVGAAWIAFTVICYLIGA